MTFISVPKKWEDEPHLLKVLEGKAAATSKTPVDAAALVDLEERLAGSGHYFIEETVKAVEAAAAALLSAGSVFKYDLIDSNGTWLDSGSGKV